MHISGDILFSKGSTHYMGTVLVADVFSENNEIKAMITVEMDLIDDLPKDLSEIDTVCFQTLILDYGLVVVSKDISLDIDYKSSNIIRLFMQVDYYEHNTNLVLADGTMIDELDPISQDEVNFYMEAFRSKRIQPK